MDFPQLPFDLPETAVHFHVEDVEPDLPDESLVSAWLQEVAAAENTPFLELNCIFCSDEHLRGINIEYLDHDYYTDIITFPFTDGAVHGDLFISTDRVADNAREIGVSFRRELCRVLVHGVLHLCGYGDKTPEEAARMREKEDLYLNRLAFPA